MTDPRKSVSIKLISLNIERSKHLDVVLPFLHEQKPDIFCVQELLERDIQKFVTALGGASYVYAPMLRHMETEGNPLLGVAIFTRLPVIEKNIQYYVGNANDIPEHRPSEMAEKGSTMNCALVMMVIEKDGEEFKIGTTHFTWSKDGQPNDSQRENMRKLIAILETSEEFVLTGDFNAPRGLPAQAGGEIFSMLAEKYKDNVPAHYATSIDGNRHRAGQLNLMVDGIFSTPGYEVSNVEMIPGLSDHRALIATISRNN